MKEKEYYTIKEIIFGLDKTYQMNISALNKLKDYCEVDQKKVKDFRFHLYKSYLSHAKPILTCKYEEKKNPLKEELDRLLSKRGLSKYPLLESPLVTDNDEYYMKLGSFPVQLQRDFISSRAFRDQADSILSSPFAHYAEKQYICANKENIPMILAINPDYIGVFIKEEQIEIPEGFITYKPYEHILKVHFDKQEITNQALENILEIEIPSTSLLRYHTGIISNSKTPNKLIYTEGIYRDKSVDLRIEEKEEEISLVKIKK